MRELEITTPDKLTVEQRSGFVLFLCSEEYINCRTFRDLQDIISASGTKTILAVPDTQYKNGLRGWAKVQILASVTDQIKGVMPLSSEELAQEVKMGWAAVHDGGSTGWDPRAGEVPLMKRDERLSVTETRDAFDIQMMELAKGVVEQSNCWLDPAGSVFAKDGKVLIEAASTSYNHSRCVEIPVDFKELQLNPGERMLFCDSLHSERVGISEAAKAGIKLDGSTMYVTKFPCRPCAQSAIAAGVTTIVFEKGSYGLSETADLFRDGRITLKKAVMG